MPRGNKCLPFDKGIPIRSFSRSIYGSREDLSKLFIERIYDGWSDQPLFPNELHLSPRLMQDFIMKANGKHEPFEGNLKEDPIGFLDHYRLSTDAGPTIGSALLFCEHPSEIDCGAYLRVEAYDKDRTLVHSEIVDESVLCVCDTVLKRLSSIMEEYLGTALGEAYPETVIKETVLNAAEHKDYNSIEPITITVFEDRIIISNPISEYQADYLKENVIEWSNCCNVVISHALKLIMPMKGWGRGKTLIIKGCSEFGCRKPVFKTTKKKYSVTIHAKKTIDGNVTAIKKAQA